MSIQVSSVSEQAGLSKAAQQRAKFLDHLLHLVQQAPATSEWLQTLRNHAIARVPEHSFPTTRDEEWRFTDLSRLMQLPLQGVEPGVTSVPSISEFALPEASTRLVFVNGVYVAELSAIALSSGVTVSPISALTNPTSIQPYLGKQSGAEELFTTLNTAGLTDGAVIHIAKSVVVDAPIHLLFLTTASEGSALTQPRCLVVAEPHSAVTFVEEYRVVGTGAYFTNAVTEIWVAENAQVSHTRIQRESPTAFHIGKTAVSQARDSRYTCNAISLGALIARHHLEIYQTGEQTHTLLNGLNLISGEQLADLHSTLALSKPYGTSRQLQKNIVDDRAHVVFNGKVLVPKAAQLTDAGQLNQNLLLSSKARVDTKPQLEIVADNVKCTHGATVGQLDTDEVFYLQSRGIDAESARKLLVYAFAYEIIDHIAIASLKDQLAQLIRHANT